MEYGRAGKTPILHDSHTPKYNMTILLIILTVLLCGIGLLLSALSLSGTWLILFAALITQFSTGVPGLWALIVFALLCVVTEAIEALAGFLGVQKRGGSKRAGLATLLGGLLGAVIGSAILPILGTFVGMLLGSFALAYVAEKMLEKNHAEAAHIARGAVWARLGVILLKVVLTAAMSLWLLMALLW